MGAAFARNIGALFLVNSDLPRHLDHTERWLARSRSLSESNSAYRLLGKVQQAKGNIAGAVQQWRDADLVSYAIEVGLLELAQANAQDALIWQREVADSLSQPLEWHKFGAALETRGEYAQAIKAYQHALALVSSDQSDTIHVSRSEINYRLAEIYRTQFGDIPEALNAYLSAAEADDFTDIWSHTLTHHKLAILLIGQDNERAVQEAQRAVELMPDYSIGHSVLGLALYAAYGNLDLAEKEIRLAIDLAPQLAWPWMHLGQLYFQAQQYELSVAAYLHAAELDPKIEEAHNMITFIRNTYLKE